ncbi:MAG: TonB-dependent receptor plug domain-containing protein, partial [Nostoc sp.]
QVINDQQITRISDAARNVSGVTPQGGYAGATDNYNIRGFTTYDNLRNGFYAQDNFVNPTNIERIEVLKGPASVLYGQFEPGGVVNYITKQPLSE